jgi:hypothetical protein
MRLRYHSFEKTPEADATRIMSGLGSYSTPKKVSVISGTIGERKDFTSPDDASKLLRTGAGGEGRTLMTSEGRGIFETRMWPASPRSITRGAMLILSPAILGSPLISWMRKTGPE